MTDSETQFMELLQSTLMGTKKKTELVAMQISLHTDEDWKLAVGREVSFRDSKEVVLVELSVCMSVCQIRMKITLISTQTSYVTFQLYVLSLQDLS